MFVSYENGGLWVFSCFVHFLMKKLTYTQKSVLNMASSNSQIDNIVYNVCFVVAGTTGKFSLIGSGTLLMNSHSLSQFYVSMKKTIMRGSIASGLSKSLGSGIKNSSMWRNS